MLKTKLDQARDSMEMATVAINTAEAELALAICDDAKQTIKEVNEKLEPLLKLFKELPARASLDNNERRRSVAKTTTDLLGSLKELEGTLVKIQVDWQKDAK